MTETNFKDQQKRSSMKAGCVAVMRLCLLSCVMLLAACAGDTKPIAQTRIPESLLARNEPGIVVDPATSTPEDLAQAYLDTYVAWEQYDANLAGIRGIVQGEAEFNSR